MDVPEDDDPLSERIIAWQKRRQAKLAEPGRALPPKRALRTAVRSLGAEATAIRPKRRPRPVFTPPIVCEAPVPAPPWARLAAPAEAPAAGRRQAWPAARAPWGGLATVRVVTAEAPAGAPGRSVAGGRGRARAVKMRGNMCNIAGDASDARRAEAGRAGGRRARARTAACSGRRAAKVCVGAIVATLERREARQQLLAQIAGDFLPPSRPPAARRGPIGRARARRSGRAARTASARQMVELRAKRRAEEARKRELERLRALMRARARASRPGQAFAGRGGARRARGARGRARGARAGRERAEADARAAPAGRARRGGRARRR